MSVWILVTVNTFLLHLCCFWLHLIYKFINQNFSSEYICFPANNHLPVPTVSLKRNNPFRLKTCWADPTWPTAWALVGERIWPWAWAWSEQFCLKWWIVPLCWGSSRGEAGEWRRRGGGEVKQAWFPGQLIEGGAGVGRAALSSHQTPLQKKTQKLIPKPQKYIWANPPENFQSLPVPWLGVQVTNGWRARSELFSVGGKSDWQPLLRRQSTESDLPSNSKGSDFFWQNTLLSITFASLLFTLLHHLGKCPLMKKINKTHSDFLPHIHICSQLMRHFYTHSFFPFKIIIIKIHVKLQINPSFLFLPHHWNLFSPLFLTSVLSHLAWSRVHWDSAVYCIPTEAQQCNIVKQCNLQCTKEVAVFN